MFRVGQKVVCIDDSNQCTETIESPISDVVVKSKTYEVRGYSYIGGLLLKGVFAGFHFSGKEAGFKTSRFRKIELDYNFVEEIIKKVQPQKQTA